MSQFNLKHYKKLSSDDNFTHLQHKDGHEVKVAHKFVSPKIRGELKAMPMEGPQQLAYGGFSTEMGNQPPPQEPSPPPDDLSMAEAQMRMLPKVAPSPDEPEVPSFASTQALMSAKPDILSKPQEYKPLFDQPSQFQQASAPVEAEQNEPANVKTADHQIELNPRSPGYLEQLQQDYARQKAGMAQEAAAVGEEGKAQAASLGQGIKDLNDFNLQTQGNLNKLLGHHQVILNDIANQHINPDQFWEDRSAPGKIATAIGLLLGGIGGGILHQENPALKYINQAIDRNVDAQRSNLANKYSLYNANRALFGDTAETANITKANLLGMTSMQMKLAAAKAQDPIAKARLMQQSAVLDQNAHQMLNQANINMSMVQLMNGANQSPEGLGRAINVMSVVNPPMAKELQERYVPGVGLASVKLEPKAREDIIGRSSLQEQISKLRSWAQTHAGSINPEDMAYGQTLAKTVQDAYRRANGQGVFREAEAKFVNGIVDEDPTKFLNKFRTDPRYKALEESNRTELNSLYKGYGLPTPKPIKTGGSGFKQVSARGR